MKVNRNQIGNELQHKCKQFVVLMSGNGTVVKPLEDLLGSEEKGMREFVAKCAYQVISGMVCEWLRRKSSVCCNTAVVPEVSNAPPQWSNKYSTLE